MKTEAQGSRINIKRKYMKKLILGLFALSALSLSAADVQKFPLVGEYVGKADAQKGWFKDSPDLSANIHKEGDDYIVVFTSAAGRFPMGISRRRKKTALSNLRM